MRRVNLIPLLLILAACGAPTPSAVPTPEIFGVTLPPKWTETASPTVSPTVTVTAAPTETPEPTVIIPPLPNGMIARRPTAAEVDDGNSIWSLTKFIELPGPGIKRYSVSVDAGSSWIWDCYICLKQDVFADNIGLISAEMKVDGKALPADALRISEKDGLAGWRCRYWSTMLSRWPAGNTVSLEIRSVYKQPVTDGDTEYPQGEYRQIISALVEAE
jgi:hypothetical protein